MDLLGALKVLVRVTETGSFSAVARERDLTQAAVARQISQLEEHFGVRLFHRTTRKLSLTDDGRMLLDLARPVLDGVEGIEASLGRQSASPVGLVRVAVSVTASHFLAERLSSLLADNPGLKVELVVSDRFGDMVEDRLDLALRIGEITDASLVQRRCGAGIFSARLLRWLRRVTSIDTENPQPLPTSRATLASCSTSARIRTCGPLLRLKAPRAFGYPVDFSPTMPVRSIGLSTGDMESLFSGC